MDNSPAVSQSSQLEETSAEIEAENKTSSLAESKPVEEKKPEGIEHDPYEWGKCTITASIVWLPDGSIMLGARNHLDAPIITILMDDALTTLPGHAAELPMPTLEAIADLLAQLRNEMPLRARAKANRDETAQKKAQDAITRKEIVKKIVKPTSAQTPASTLPQTKPSSDGRAPAPLQASLFSLMTGGN